MIYTIKKNRHYSGLHFNLNYNKKIMQREVVFSNNCKYIFDDVDRFDINKLFGFSEGLHHKNSARFGWLYNPHNDMMELHAYVYADGVRDLKDTFICAVNFSVSLNLLIEAKEDHYLFTVIAGSFRNTYTKKMARGKATKKYGYDLYPYFGGNKKAPHEMDISIHTYNETI